MSLSATERPGLSVTAVELTNAARLGWLALKGYCDEKTMFFYFLRKEKGGI